jgi:rhamnosyltransferase
VENRVRVAAVIPAYEPGQNLLELVAALAPQVTAVVVVDDGSPTGGPTIDAAAERGARVIRHETNRGIAAALNTGVRAAVSDDDILGVLTVDQDSQVPPGFVGALVDGWERAERDGVRVGLVAPEHISGLPRQRSGRPPVQSGLLLPVATIRRVGDFDEGLVIDGVDDDFALRCLDAGLALVVAENITLGHHLGQTHEVHVAGRTVTLTRSAPFRYYYLTRNRIRLVGRHAQKHPGWAVRQVVGAAGHLGLVLALDPERSSRAREAWRGVRDGIRGATGARPNS